MGGFPCEKPRLLAHKTYYLLIPELGSWDIRSRLTKPEGKERSPPAADPARELSSKTCSSFRQLRMTSRPRSPPPSWHRRRAPKPPSRKPSSSPYIRLAVRAEELVPAKFSTIAELSFATRRVRHLPRSYHRTITKLRATTNCQHPRKSRRSGGVSTEPHPLMPKCNGNKWGQRQDFPVLCWDPARRLLPLPRTTEDGSTSSIATHRLAPRARIPAALASSSERACPICIKEKQTR